MAKNQRVPQVLGKSRGGGKSRSKVPSVLPARSKSSGRFLPDTLGRGKGRSRGRKRL